MIFRRKMFKKRNRKICRNIRWCVFLSSIIALIVFVDSTVSDVIGPLAIKNAEELINNKINTVVSEILAEDKLSYQNLIHTVSNDGEVSYVQADSTVINNLKSKIVTMVDKELDSSKNLKTIVQIGSLINSSLLSNRGPEITVYFDLYCSTGSNLYGEFLDAGLNQTLHRIKLNVITEFCLMIINDQYFDKITNDYIVAESVIVGDVPSAYGSVYGLTAQKDE